MPSNQTEDQKLTARANDLYWHSGQSVNQIAEEMDLSKSRLYGLVRPLPVGSPCPDCQTELLFPNRTAMEKGFVTCPECGVEGAVDKVPVETGKAAPKKRRIRKKTGPSRAKSATNGQATTQPAPSSEADEGAAQEAASALAHRRVGSKRVLWGSVLLGAAAGLYIAIRQRRS